MSTPPEVLNAALAGQCETARVDFKRSFDPISKKEWLELIKDIVAMSNAGGGVIVVGVEDSGVPSGFDCAQLASVDPATLADKLFANTGTHEVSFQFYFHDVSGTPSWCIDVEAGRHVVLFSTSGTYSTGDKGQASAFQQGVIYWRHGAKSEPAHAEDIRGFIERSIASVRGEWIERLRQVVEAPAGSIVSVLSSNTSNPVGARISAEPGAIPMNPRLVNETYPHRQKELVGILRGRLPDHGHINSYDIQCLRRRYSIDTNLAYCYIPRFGSPLFSDQFVDLAVGEVTKDPDLLAKLRAAGRGSST